MINGFLHWIAITGFNQFIIPPSFWVLTVTLWELIELASPQGFPTKRSCLTTGDFGCWLACSNLISSFSSLEKKNDVCISQFLPTKCSHFVFHFQTPISFEVQDVGTAKSLTSDNGWELVVLVKIIIKFLSFSEAAAISSLTT